jgi:DNA-binding IclR family transcriptional regulator
MNRPAAARYNVPGLERGLRVLQLFDRNRPVLSAADMARALGIPRSTAFRIAQTLEPLGFLVRDGDAYRIGPAVLRLGFEYISSLDITDLARPMLDRLRDDSGASAQLVIRDGRDVVVVMKAASSSAFASSVNVGTRLPAHATILGRVLLFDTDDQTLQSLYPDGKLVKVNAQTPRTVAELKRLVQQDRARGYAVSESFYEAGVSAIAAPVRDGSGKTIAAVSITLHRPAFESPQARERLIERVLHAASELSQQLNYRPAAA